MTNGDENSMKTFFRSGKINSLSDENSTEKLLKNIQGLLEKLVNKNKIVPYNSGATNLPIAVINQPSDVDNINPANGGYYNIQIKEILQRRPDIIYLICNGPGDIFAVPMYNSTTSSQSEFRILEGDRGAFYSIDELRIRTTTANTEYVVTENEKIRPRDVTFLRGNPYISIQILPPGAARTENIATSAIPPLGLGKNAHIGFIINGGPGALTVAFSYDGINFSLPYTLLAADGPLNFDDVHTLIVTNIVGGSMYRLYAK